MICDPVDPTFSVAKLAKDLSDLANFRSKPVFRAKVRVDVGIFPCVSMTSGKGDLTENIMKGFVDNFENVAVNKKISGLTILFGKQFWNWICVTN